MQLSSIFLSLGDTSRFTLSTAHQDRINSVINNCTRHVDSVMVIKSDNRLNLNSSVKVSQVKTKFSPNGKRILCFFASFVWHKLLLKMYFKDLSEIIEIVNKYKKKGKVRLICIEFIDVVVGFILKKNNIIDELYIDILGLSDQEFRVAAFSTKNVMKKMYFNFKKKVAIKLMKKIFNSCDCYISASESFSKYLSIKYAGSTKSILLPYCLTGELSSSTCKDNSVELALDEVIQSGKQVVSFIGSFKFFSGVDVLVDAFEYLLSMRDDVFLLIVGHGRLQKLINKKLQNFDTDSYLYVNRVQYSQVSRIFLRSSVIINPEKYNDFSNNILHLKFFDALLSGKPIVSPGFNSLHEFIKSGGKCSLFEPNNPRSLALAINNVLNNIDYFENISKVNKSIVREKYFYQNYFDYNLAKSLVE